MDELTTPATIRSSPGILAQLVESDGWPATYLQGAKNYLSFSLSLLKEDSEWLSLVLGAAVAERS